MMYRPESPFDAVEDTPVFRPESPFYEPDLVYRPSSPHLEYANLGRLGKLLSKIRNPFPKDRIWKAKYVPISNFQNYISWKEIMDNNYAKTPEALERFAENRKVIVTKQTATGWKDEMVPVVNRPLPTIKGLEDPYTKLTVVGDTVKVTIEPPPFYVLHDKYYSKGVLPPLNIYFQQMKKLGYTNEELERALTSFEKKQKKIQEDYEIFMNTKK